jgi:hypothetical protein
MIRTLSKKIKNNIAIILYFIAILTLLVVVLFSDFVKEENIKTILTTEEKYRNTTIRSSCFRFPLKILIKN